MPLSVSSSPVFITPKFPFVSGLASSVFKRLFISHSTSLYILVISLDLKSRPLSLYLFLGFVSANFYIPLSEKVKFASRKKDFLNHRTVSLKALRSLLER